MLQIIVGEQYLRDIKIVFGEELLVNGHETGLTDGGARLQFREFTRTPIVLEESHPGTNSSRTYQHHLTAALPLPRDLRDELLHLRQVGLFFGIGQDACPELDHNPRSIFEKFSAHNYQ